MNRVNDYTNINVRIFYTIRENDNDDNSQNKYQKSTKCYK